MNAPSTSVLNSAPPTLATVPLWIDGRPTAALSSRFGDITNAATGRVVRVVPYANAADVDAAVAAANAQLTDYARVQTWVRGAVPFDAEHGMSTANGRPKRDAIEARHRARMFSEGRCEPA